MSNHVNPFASTEVKAAIDNRRHMGDAPIPGPRPTGREQAWKNTCTQVRWYWSDALAGPDGYDLFLGHNFVHFPGPEWRIEEALNPPIASRAERREVNWDIEWNAPGGRASLISLEVKDVAPKPKIEQQIDEQHADAVATRPDSEWETFDKPTETPADQTPKPLYLGHTAVPDEAIHAIPNHLKRELNLAPEKVGLHVRNALGTATPDYIGKHGVQAAWDKALDYVAKHKNENGSKNGQQAASSDGSATEIPATASTPVPDEKPRSEPANVSPEVKATETPKADQATGEIVVYDAQRAIERMMQRSDIMTGIHQSKLLKAGIDYGVIPGTDNKMTLLKPGAEKLCTAFGLCPEFRLVDKQTVWSPDAPLFYYQYECRLTDIATGKVVATGIGSCNSMESKYRWRNANRTCPKCGKELRKSKNKPEFYCWDKTGGCGATFKEDDPVVKNQQLGKVPNDDVFSLVNTIDKMAQKRALIAATLIGANASAFYSQDLEDLPQFGYIDAEFVEPAA